MRWNGEKLEYYEHQPNRLSLPLRRLLPLLPGYAWFQAVWWAAAVLHLPFRLLRTTALRSSPPGESAEEQE